MNTSKQLANTVLMVRPVDFCFNEETAVDNEFQNKLEESNEKINALAMEEFAQMVEKLREEDINVLVLEQGENKVKTPDAVFPNNWFSTEHDGTVLLYPMLTLNRRAEKNRFLDVEELLAKNNYFVKNLINIGKWNENKLILEGTGCLIFEHNTKSVYAAKSERCHEEQFANFVQLRGYKKSFLFETKSSKGKPIYHTNVVMSIADKFVIICSECFVSEKDKKEVLENISKTHHVIEISLAQMEKNFCGNILQVKSNKNEPITIMSQTAYEGFTEKQLSEIAQYGKILPVNIPTIEKVGGGSARCMMAEVFLASKK